jgi:hypothetical protein
MRRVYFLSILMALGLCGASIAISQIGARDSYSMALKEWEKSEKVGVSDQAQFLIRDAYQRKKSRLAEFGGERVWKGTTRTLNQSVLVYYLGDLRDQKAGTDFTWKSMTIEAADVKAHPFESFLDTLEPVLKGARGELHVVSEPTGAQIRLDGSPRGSTEKITVESAGEHKIVVKGKGLGPQCEDRLVVPDGGTVTFHCP